MTNDPIYFERISSKKTEILFVSLAFLFALPFAWFARIHLFGGWSILFFCLFAFFLFYSLNYRTLIIQMDKSNLRLRFGLFQWTIPLQNIESCFPDPTSLQRIGGAGIHFTFIGRRYRAMFNFLEYSRVVMKLKIKKGPVRDIAFSTLQPEELIRLINKYGKTESAA
jgi:Ca2+/Na+ antiporter